MDNADGIDTFKNEKWWEYRYRRSMQKEAEKAQMFVDELRPVANRIFSTEDGRKYARQMIRACHLLEVEPRTLPSESLQRLQAQKDFVNLFITRLIDREVFIGILKEI